MGIPVGIPNGTGMGIRGASQRFSEGMGRVLGLKTNPHIDRETSLSQTPTS